MVESPLPGTRVRDSARGQRRPRRGRLGKAGAAVKPKALPWPTIRVRTAPERTGPRTFAWRFRGLLGPVRWYWRAARLYPISRKAARATQIRRRKTRRRHFTRAPAQACAASSTPAKRRAAEPLAVAPRCHRRRASPRPSVKTACPCWERRRTARTSNDRGLAYPDLSLLCGHRIRRTIRLFRCSLMQKPAPNLARLLQFGA
jgi:hypothetical protein